MTIKLISWGFPETCMLIQDHQIGPFLMEIQADIVIRFPLQLSELKIVIFTSGEQSL